MRRFFSILLLIAILVAAGYGVYRWWQARQAANAPQFQTARAERGDLMNTVGATGIVRAQQTAILTWGTTGKISVVHVKPGDRVKAGTILAELEETSLPQNIILARADLVNNQKALEDLKRNAETAKIEAMKLIATYAQQVKNAQYQLDNFVIPPAQANLSAIEAVDLMQQRLDEARAAFEPYKFAPLNDPKRQELKQKLDQAQSDYNAAVKRLEYEYQLEIATASLQKARLDYERWKNGPDPNDIAIIETRIAAAQATLKLAYIEAPFEGTITSSDVHVGDLVSPGFTAFRLDDLSTLLVDVQVSEIDVNRIQIGQKATLTFDAILNREYSGEVVEVDRVGTSFQGVVDFVVTVKLLDADELVKPGMTAAVNIVVAELENVLLVPNRAVRLKNNNRIVYILRDGLPVEVKITLGASSDVMSEVIGGELKEGDLIILNPPIEFQANGRPPFAR